MSFKYLSLKPGEYALSVTPPYGIAVYNSKIINRDNPRAELSETEIEGAIAQAIWKMFDEERTIFASQLNISELDVVLVDVRVLSIKIDGDLVLNPLGFTGSKIEIKLAEIITTREISDAIADNYPKSGESLLALEPTASCAWTLHKNSKNKDFLLVKISESKTFISQSDDNRISHIKSFDWGTLNMIDFIKDELEVSPIIAKKMMSLYASKSISKEVSQFLRPIISKSMNGFFKEMTEMGLDAKIKKPLTYVINEDFDLLLEDIILPKSAPFKFNFLPNVPDPEIALHEYATGLCDNVFNKIAKRRMKWLMSHR